VIHGPLFGDPAAINPRRAMFLYALGALLGLGLAGYGLFTAEGTVVRKVPPESVALVNNRPILRSDFSTQLENETGAPFSQATRAQQLKVLGDMVREELLVQRGLELDFAETDQDTRNALVSAMTQLAVAQVTLAGVPDEATLRRYFAEHREKYATPGSLTVEDWFLPGTLHADSGVSDAIVSALRDQPATDVAVRYGLKRATGADQDWYWVAELHLGRALFQHVKSLRAGEVAGPLVQADGVHFAVVRENEAPVLLSFEKSQPQVAGDYARSAQNRLTQDTLTFLRNRSRILIADDYSDYKP